MEWQEIHQNRYILCQQSIMFCLRVSESRYKRFVSEDMDMSEMRSRTRQGYQCREKYTDRRIKTNSIKKYIGQGLPELTPVEIVGYEVDEAGSPLV